MPRRRRVDGQFLRRGRLGQTIGARGFARFKGTAFDLPQELEVGYFARGDRATSTQDRIEAATGFPYKREADLDSKLGDVGLYADANVKLLRWLNLPWRSCVSTYTAKAGTMAFDPQSVPVNPSASPDAALRDLYDFMASDQSTQGHLNRMASAL